MTITRLSFTALWRLAFVFLFTPAVAIAAEPVEISASLGHVQVGRHLEFAEDKRGTLTLADVIDSSASIVFRKADRETPNFGLGVTSAYWFRFSMTHRESSAARVFLELANPYFDGVEVYLIRRDGPVEASRITLDQPISERAIAHRNFVFPIDVEAEETLQVVFRVITEGSFRVPARLWYGERLWEADGQEIAVQGIFYGLLLVMALYNLFVFFSLRETAYLWYALFVASTGLSAAGLTGFAAQYLVSDEPSLAKSLFLLGLGIGTWSGHRFVIDFLSLRDEAPKFFLVSSYISTAGILCALASFVFSYPSVLRVSLAVMILGTPSVLVASLVRMQQGSIEARYYFASGVCLALAVSTGGLTSFGVLPVNPLTVYAVQIGLAIQVVLLSLGLARKMKTLFDANLRIQAAAARNLQVEVDSQTIELQAQTRDALRMRARAEIARLNAVASQAEADELRQAAEEDAKKLRELDQQKTAFFQNMSHELRTPLTLILNPLENQSRRDPDNVELLAATKNSRRLLRLVNQLLDFQKLEAGKKKLTLSALNLVHFTHVVGDYFETSCQVKGIHFDTTFDGEPLRKDGQITIQAEADALEKVVFNLLSNAFKYTQSGGRIELGLSRQGESHIRLFVTDTGPGISEDGQAKLFQVFSQLEESTTREYEGTGLGLALAKSLVEEMGGVIGVESRLGVGSTFFADFPMLDNSVEKELKPLLIIEDDEASLRMYRIALSKVPELAEFDQALDYRSAEVLLAEHSYRLVVSDGNIPGGDGAELLTRVRVQSPLTKLVLITGEHNQDRFHQALNEARIDEILLKPVELPDLRRVLKHWFDSYTAEADVNEDFQARPWLLADGGETGRETEVKEEGAVGIDAEGKGQLVLVVDDLEDMRTLIGNALIERGYRVIKAANGAQGYDVVCEHQPDLVISDWMMPKLSGPDMLRKVRANPTLATTPFILLTAKSDEESKLIGTEIGADIFLGKPFNDQELGSAVRNLLSLKSREKEVEKLNVYITESVLKRYLPPALIGDILSGQLSMDKPAELRNITVLFSDLKGFTRTSEALGPEGISAFLNAYLTVMNEVIFEFGGTIDKFIGDAIMVLFGAPQDMDPATQVAQATSCALAMQKRLETLCRGWDNQEAAAIRMRIGIHHGPAVVGNFGSAQRSDYTAIGPTVNMASRIESACQAGEVFISEDTAGLLPPENLETVGDFDLKGIDGSTVLYRVKRSKSKP